MSVPVDYNNPGGAQAKLAVIRVPATGQRIGSLLINPGGPGGSAIDMAAGIASDLQGSDITRDFDLVGFDPRGVGHSTPALRCRTDAEFDAYRREPMVDYSPAGVAHIEQLNRQLAQQCVNRMGNEFLANTGTSSVVRDMDIVRQALGDEQISYLGYSYGTEMGTAYLEAFPDHVRTMVLDGAIDPTEDPVQREHRTNGGIPDRVQRLRRGLRPLAGLPVGHRPGAVRQPVSRAGRPAGREAGPDVGPARSQLCRRDDRHHQRAVHPAALEVPDQRPARAAARTRTRAIC